MCWVYILKTSSGRFYVGSTTSLDERIRHHIGGYTPSTKRLGNTELVFSQKYPSLAQARSVERKLKRLKRRDYIEKILKEGNIRITP